MTKTTHQDRLKAEATERDKKFLAEYEKLVKQGETLPEVAKHFGFASVRVLQGRRSRACERLGIKVEAIVPKHVQKAAERRLSVPEPADDGYTLEELVALRKRRFERKAAAEDGRRKIEVAVPVDGPFAIWFFGDPHVDDDGTDIATLERHSNVIRETEALYGANVGDTTNNWVGRLARLYAEQGTTAKEAWQLAEWFIKLVGPKWLFMIGGNHDTWSGAGDPLIWISREQRALYESSEVRMELKPPQGRSLVINARHDFAGNSQWNPTHAVMKAAQLGTRDDVLVCGHKHTTGYQPLKCPETKKIMHCLQVASYKIYDRYAREKGFRDQAISPGAMIVVDPNAKNDAAFIQVFHDFDLGVEFLAFLRSKQR
jgi:hypothetical protein